MSTSIGDSIRKAVVWRSGSQILAQVVSWGSTLAVIRILDPADYGIFAMTEVVLSFLSFLTGYGFASSLIHDREITQHKIKQAFGLLIVVNVGLAIIQLALAPLAALYYGQPIVAKLLSLQAFIYLSTPFIALPLVLLTREMDFKRPALVNIIAAIVAAIVALTCALLGWGVWTLVYSALAMFWARGIGLMIAAKFFVWPSFQFRGTGAMFNFGAMVLGSHFFWTVLTKADIFIAASWLSPDELGFYAEALFLTTMVASKFVPPLNDVAFPTYARVQDDPETLARFFLKSVRLIMLLTTPMHIGLAVVAGPLVSVVLGEKWAPLAPLASILALAMPAYTLHILFAPALNAVGQPGVNMKASLFGAALMPIAFLVGIQWGAVGLAISWVIAFPLIPAFAFMLARRHLAINARQMLGAIAPALAASAFMGVAVMAVDNALPQFPDWARLLLLMATGAIAYGGLLFTFSRETLHELLALVRRQKPELEDTPEADGAPEAA